MTVYLVRHAAAGDRSAWHGDDRDRPLSGRGWKQAQALAERFATLGATSLRSSPYVRCVQTLEPAAELTGLAVQTDARLAEGAAFEDVLELIAEAGDGAVLCSHGDVIPETIDALARRGVDITTAPDWRKASVWVLTGDDAGIRSAAAEPPPDR